MPINYRMKFETSAKALPSHRLRYVGRFWDPATIKPDAPKGTRFDTKLVVPDDYWIGLGHKVPTRDADKMLQLAVVWASKKAAELQAHRDTPNDIVVARRPKTLRELLAWYASQNPNDAKPLTLIKYEDCSRRLIAFFGAGRDPSTIDQDSFVSYRKFEQERGIRNRTIKGDGTFLKQVLVYGWEHREKSGMRDYRFLKMPKIAKQKSRKRPLTIAELRRITPVRLPRDGDRIVRMVLVAAVTGLRRDILLNLEESWIDRRNALLCVPGQAMKGGEDRWGDEDFEVPLCKWALELIPKPPSRLAKFCFANPKNGQPNKQIDRSLWKIAAAMDGCKKSEGACAAARHEHRWFCLQELRMTFLTLLDKAGVEFAVREYLVGHAPTGVSEESYIRRHIEVLRAAVAKMDDLRGEIEASTGGNVVRFTG